MKKALVFFTYKNILRFLRFLLGFFFVIWPFSPCQTNSGTVQICQICRWVISRLGSPVPELEVFIQVTSSSAGDGAGAFLKVQGVKLALKKGDWSPICLFYRVSDSPVSAENLV